MRKHTVAMAVTLGLTSWVVGCGNVQSEAEAADTNSTTEVVVKGAPVPASSIEREFWLALAEEPGWHLDKARDDFLNGQNGTASRELEKVAAILNFEVRHRHSPKEERFLIGSVQELREVARQLSFEEGSVMEAPSSAEVDHVMALAFRTLAAHQVTLGREALEAGDARMAGRYIQETVKAIQRGFELVEVDPGTALASRLEKAGEVGERLAREGDGSREEGLGSLDHLGEAVNGLGNVLTSRRK